MVTPAPPCPTPALPRWGRERHRVLRARLSQIANQEGIFWEISPQKRRFYAAGISVDLVPYGIFDLHGQARFSEPVMQSLTVRIEKAPGKVDE